MKVRRRIAVRGVVQGVGFRPFVYGLAHRLGLAGQVRNDADGVTIDVEGEPAELDGFLRALEAEAPALAVIQGVEARAEAVRAEVTFTIAPSAADPAPTALLPADVATCEACLAELDDPADRRHRYPFLNCTQCGPRFTIVTALPYDRERTTMAAFTMCAACRAEYENPKDRRFHAQPTACPACGPRLALRSADGRLLASGDPLGEAAARLRAGGVVAVKGLGGYHLACDAADDGVVRELRRRKRRDARPLAIMVADLETARRLAAVGPAEAALLASPARPIVLLRRRPDAAVAPSVAPGTVELGLMLPYTPLHHGLLQAASRPLVMTSGNHSEEPIAIEDPDAFARLGSIADCFLTHDRPIRRRCDDSVARLVAGRPRLLRRARGFAPLPIRLPGAAPVPILACGGQLKNTVCLARDDQAILSPHIGDLDDYATYRSFVETIAHLQRCFDVTPRAVAHDWHPDYVSTRYAVGVPGVRRIPVQHHHAHVASCLAENGAGGPVIGVAWDGTGYGPGGRIWGGEFLIADYEGFVRAGHLEEVPLPGGEQAVRQPWRMALVYLERAYGAAALDLELDVVRRLDRQAVGVLRRMIARGVNAPLSSSAGRLFDAVAALLGVRWEVEYEAQAAIELEAVASGEAAEPYPFRVVGEGWPLVVETGGLVTGVVDDIRAGATPPGVAARFHATLAEVVRSVCKRIRERTGLARVALSGGVFQNARLLADTTARLAAAGFEAYTHARVPPNDGGLALGQAAVAAAVLARTG